MKTPELLTTCFGLGKIPFAPGTFGSLPPVVLFQTLGYLYPAAIIPLMITLTVLFSWICVHYSPAVIERVGKKDPGMIVADEVAGQAVTMLIIAFLAPANICNATAGGFLLFRFFDITKLPPCKQLEKLPAGIGILADDLAAGVYAGLTYVILAQFFPQYCG